MLAVLALLVLAVALPVSAYTVVLVREARFTDLPHYMYDSSAKALVSVDTDKVAVLSYSLQDKDPSDQYMPAVLLSINQPSKDLSTNESIHYAWVLSGATGGSVIIAVADVNGTSVTSIQFYKIGPVLGDLSIVRTGYDIIIEYAGFKFSILLSGFANPTVLVMTDTSFIVTGLSYLELRSLTNPPPGYTLIRNGTGEAEFTISASSLGRLYVWFDESHDYGDLDLFVFDQSHPRFSTVSVHSSWTELHQAYLLNGTVSTEIAADYGPGWRWLTVTGVVKFIVKQFGHVPGDPSRVSWRVACLHEPLPTRPPETRTTTTSPATTQTQTTPKFADVLNQLAGAVQASLSNQPAVAVLAAVLLFLLLLVLVLRGGGR